MKNLFFASVITFSTCTLIACGGSSGSGGSSKSSASSSTATTASITGTVSGLPDATQVGIRINNGSSVTLSSNGVVTLAQTWDTNEAYHVQVTAQPNNAYCVVMRGIGKPITGSVNDIRIECATGSAAESAQLFDTDKLHHMRLTVNVDEWNAFTLSNDRSFLQSEIYRIDTLEYLDSDNNLLATVPNVGFRMRGNTSRTLPESWENGEPLKPRRFHINVKFDETFEDDESVYACIDDNGNPAKIDSTKCLNRLATDIPEVAENDGRTFMGVESVALKMNKDDPTYIREALAHTILRDNGAAVGRTSHISLELVITASETSTQLYGKNLPQTYHMGVFTLDEAVDKVFVKNRYGKNGYLFKIGVSNLMQGDDPECIDYNPSLYGYTNNNYCDMGVEVIDPSTREDWVNENNAFDADYVNNMRSYTNNTGNSAQFTPYRPSFDLKTKKDEITTARTELNALIAVISNDPTIEELAAVFDIDSFIRAQAADIVVGAVDHYVRIANNYYLYQHPTTKKWYYLSYDYDFSFRNNHPVQWTSNPIPVFDSVIASTIFTASNGNRWADKNLGYEPELYNIIFADQTNRDKLLTQIGELRRTWLDWEHRTQPLTEAWLDKIAPEIAKTTAGSDAFEDTTFNRNAATGNSYSFSLNGSNRSSTDTLKNYIQGRNTTLLQEAP